MTDPSFYEDYFVSFGAGFFVFMIIIALVSFALAVVFYILNAIGFSKIAKKMGHPTPYFAWIPFVNSFLIGELAKEELKRVKNIYGPHTLYDNLGIFLIVVPLAGGFLGIIPVIGYLLSLAASVFSLYLACTAIFHIYKQFVGDSSAVGFVILYVFLPPAAMLYISSKEILYPNAYTEQHRGPTV